MQQPRLSVFAGQMGSAPGEYGLPVYFLKDDVGHQTTMPSIAAGKAMDADQPVLEPQGHFIRRVGVIIPPILGIVAQALQFCDYVPKVSAQVLCGFSKGARPCLC